MVNTNDTHAYRNLNKLVRVGTIDPGRTGGKHESETTLSFDPAEKIYFVRQWDQWDNGRSIQSTEDTLTAIDTTTWSGISEHIKAMIQKHINTGEVSE